MGRLRVPGKAKPISGLDPKLVFRLVTFFGHALIGVIESSVSPRLSLVTARS